MNRDSERKISNKNELYSMKESLIKLFNLKKQFISQSIELISMIVQKTKQRF